MKSTAENTRPIRSGGDPFGTHRAIDPKGSLPQPAQRVDNDMTRLFDGELLLAVETLNVDAASFRQMEDEARSEAPGIHGDALAKAVGAKVLRTIGQRGKQHNPVTGSGGMLLGRVVQLAPGRGTEDLKVGDRVASLVSLSLTPLVVTAIRGIRPVSAQLDVDGEAILFASGAYAKIPSDMPERLALAVLDVAGAAPQVARLVKPGSSVAILGAGGKSGILCAVEARRVGGPNARIVGVENHPDSARELLDLDICDAVVSGDARDPVAVRKAIIDANRGSEVDVSFSCVNVEDSEMGAILSTRDRGVVYFFAMSTSFTKAALGAEGVGKDVDLMIGNGFAANHANHSLEMMRTFPKVRALFERRYG